jgi:hypothetical protein
MDRHGYRAMLDDESTALLMVSGWRQPLDTVIVFDDAALASALVARTAID